MIIHTNMSDGSFWIQVAADHELSFEKAIALHKTKYDFVPIEVERGFDYSNKYGWFCKWAVPIENYLSAHPEERTSLMKQARVIKAGKAWQTKFGVVDPVSERTEEGWARRTVIRVPMYGWNTHWSDDDE